MDAMHGIAWFIGIVTSIGLIYMTFGNAMLVAMFPEGRRWWFWPLRFAAMLFFAALVHFHPFSVGV